MTPENHRVSVLHFSNSVARGGAEEHILTLLRGLDLKQFKLGWACPSQIASSVRQQVPDGVRVFEIDLRAPTQFIEVLALARLLRREKVQILHCHQFRASAIAAPIGRACAVPLIIETPHIREHWRTKGIKAGFWIDRNLGRLVDHYIAVSEANAKYLIEQKGLPSRKITVIQNGCDLTRFDLANAASPALRQTFNIGADDELVIAVGRLEEQKGHRVLIRAWPTVISRFPTARLVCLGSGSLRSELERLASDVGVSESVQFLGQRTDISDWFATADLMVLPSFYEGLPIVAVESLASGCPVVATAVDGTPEVVVDGKTGLTVAPGDESALASAICRLLANPTMRHEFASAGRQLVIAKFDQVEQVHRTQELYLKALTKNVLTVASTSDSTDFAHAKVATRSDGRSAEFAFDGVTSRICEQTTKAAVGAFSAALDGIILTGSCARGEGTVRATAEGVVLEGDAEFLLVFNDTKSLPSAACINDLTKQVTDALRCSGISSAVTLVPCRRSYLRNLRPHIFGFELSRCGKTIWGPENLLSLIPSFHSEQIPVEDAWQLLCNRIIEMLEYSDQASSPTFSASSSLFYRTVKLYLDMATSLLIFAGGYRPSYRERAIALRALASTTNPNVAWPFDLRTFSELVEWCTEWKLSSDRLGASLPAYGNFQSAYAFWEASVDYAHRLWRWELERMTGTGAAQPDRELFKNLCRQQALSARVRGWMHVVRTQGWHRSWRQWPRWIPRAIQGSPRYWIYGAAGELFFDLPVLVNSKADIARPRNWEDLRRQLPFDSKNNVGAAPENGWKRVASGIVSNYYQFLVSTRS